LAENQRRRKGSDKAMHSIMDGIEKSFTYFAEEYQKGLRVGFDWDEVSKPGKGLEEVKELEEKY
jgi:uncharacterized protein YabN with tetrapyrrole methylase and pyrophosphatase domain